MLSKLKLGFVKHRRLILISVPVVAVAVTTYYILNPSETLTTEESLAILAGK